MFDKYKLYVNTIKYMKLSQVFYRVKKIIKKRINRSTNFLKGEIPQINVSTQYVIPELDFDNSYLSRYNVDDILKNKFNFLHYTESIDLQNTWETTNASHLWRYNQHYFEYIFPLAAQFKTQNKTIFFDKFKELITSWINLNPLPIGDGWHPYTISLRLTNWICGYQLFFESLKNEKEFQVLMKKSIYVQYRFLQENLEKDVLGNHYFENIKALIASSIFLNDTKVLNTSLEKLLNQLNAQILEDGMHFELSPMYHKIILEDLLKIAFWIKDLKNQINEKITEYLQSMINFAYSIEKDMGTTPLFNDGGNNISKSLDSLLNTARKYFGLEPFYISEFKESGYFLIHNGNKKVVIDSGKVCPDYLPAHGHCDALSYELSIEGNPFIVNSGTFEYEKGKLRNFFRSTRAHNTLMIGNYDQSQCWSSFRVASRVSENIGEMKTIDDILFFKGSYSDYRRNKHTRVITFLNPEIFVIVDKVKTFKTTRVKNFIHFNPDYNLKYNQDCSVWKQDKKVACIYPINSYINRIYYGEDENGWYAPEYGCRIKNYVLELISSSENSYIGYVIDFSCKNLIIETDLKVIILKYLGQALNIDLNKLGL